VQMLSLVNTRANAEGALKFIDEAALDPYVFTRESFLQWRNHLASDGKTDASSDMTDIDADLLEDEQGNGKKVDAKNGAVSKGPLPSGIVSSTKNTTVTPLNAKNKNTLRLLPPDTDKNSTINVLKLQGKTKKEAAAPLKN
jgi:phospholipid-binding lipoprotein MlaA